MTIPHWLKKHPPKHIIELLSPFVTESRQHRIQSVVANRLDTVHVALEHPYDPHNAAAVIRNCEALGVMNLHIISAEHDGIRSQGVTQGSHHWIRLHFYDDLSEFLAKMQPDYFLAGAIMQGELTVSEVPIDKPLCLMFGNENRGLSQAAISACQGLFRIPMFGMSESFNLSVSTGISLYDVTSRKREAVGATDLTSTQAQQLMAQYYMNSVQHRLLEQLL